MTGVCRKAHRPEGLFRQLRSDHRTSSTTEGGTPVLRHGEVIGIKISKS